ncbi:MAG: GNAT family N-acetyltransferase [Pseudomonadota bacterium]
MIIRPGERADAHALAALHASVFDRPWSAEDFAGWLERRDAFLHLAAADTETLAFGLALQAGEDAELLTLTTAPTVRRRGLGRRVLSALSDDARQRGLQRWILEVAEDNAAALALYRNAGFVELALRKAYYPGEEGRVDALVLSKAIT